MRSGLSAFGDQHDRLTTKSLGLTTPIHLSWPPVNDVVRRSCFFSSAAIAAWLCLLSGVGPSRPHPENPRVGDSAQVMWWKANSLLISGHNSVQNTTWLGQINQNVHKSCFFRLHYRTFSHLTHPLTIRGFCREGTPHPLVRAGNALFAGPNVFSPFPRSGAGIGPAAVQLEYTTRQIRMFAKFER